MSQQEKNTLDHRLSVVVPMYNEEDNVSPMVERVHAALSDYPYQWELIIVNDGSHDATSRRLHAERERWGGHIRVIDLQRNFGQTAAMQAGIDAARGEVIATLDGDLQNDPKDIPRMAKRLLDENLDLVSGWRKDRKDKALSRKLPSKIANRLIARVTNVYLHDYGCSLKVFRANVIKGVRLYGEMHRFIPAWITTHTTRDRIKEEVVTHHARKFGESKYGLTRTFRVVLDLISVYFFLRYRARPAHFFGKIAIIFGSVGWLALFYLAFVKFLLGEDIGGRPLLLIGIMCVMMSVQFLTTGILSELIARTYFESGTERSYVVRNPEHHDVEDDDEWHGARD